jgi:hypothetical protein
VKIDKTHDDEILKMREKCAVSPNLLLDGGSTLLQRAMAHNQVREVRELLRHGVDPNQGSIFGLEGASNLEEAALLMNDASRLVLEHFQRAGKV